MSMTAREFMDTMENLINSPNQRLIGNLTGGYVYAVDEDGYKPELMYAATEISKANRKAAEAQNQLDAIKYAINDVFGVAELHRKMALEIKQVIFNNPATVVFWMDGTKTVVKVENEDFDPEKGLAMAIAKKVYGNTGSYYNQFKKHIQPYHKQLLSDIRKLHDQGKSEKEISDALGIGSVAKLRNLKAKLIREEKAEYKMELYDYQKKAVSQMKNGCILCGGVGSGKSRTALAYYFFQEGGELLGNVAGDNYLPMNDSPKDLYIITTARKRDTLEWEGELSPFLLSTKSEHNLYHNKVVVDSWNNIKKYAEIVDAFFIFDEQRVVGSGAWVKSFLKIAKSNQWILLSATPGDTWQDYIPVFIANGFYRNRTEFTREHIVYSRFSKFPKVDRYLNVGRLIRQRNAILVNMDFKRTTVSHHEDVFVKYNIKKYKDVARTRWNPYKDEPIVNAGELCYVWRKIVNTDQSRQVALLEIIEKHPRAIIFYNFDYELDILKNLAYGDDVEIAEWNGHCHQPVPDSKKWVYLVQYNAGAEGWNCIKTDTIIFYSQNYSYKIMKQSSGRIDRLNTPFKDLYYYHLKSRSGIDLAISRTLKEKKDFNATGYAKRYTFTPEALSKAA